MWSCVLALIVTSQCGHLLIWKARYVQCFATEVYVCTQESEHACHADTPFHRLKFSPANIFLDRRNHFICTHNKIWHQLHTWHPSNPDTARHIFTFSASCMTQEAYLYCSGILAANIPYMHPMHTFTKLLECPSSKPVQDAVGLTITLPGPQ